jgi:hypothetical protein
MLKKDLHPTLIHSLCSDNDKALEFVADIKWEKGFICRKCDHTNYCSGKTAGSRRCTRCKKEESATAHTIFHNCKFPIHKAFYIFNAICLEKRKISAHSLSHELGLNPMTCWKFRKKIKECIERQQDNPNKDVDLIEILMTR